MQKYTGALLKKRFKLDIFFIKHIAIHTWKIIYVISCFFQGFLTYINLLDISSLGIASFIFSAWILDLHENGKIYPPLILPSLIKDNECSTSSLVSVGNPRR